jgi:hypothetical protein
MNLLHRMPPASATNDRYEEICAQISSIPVARRPPSLLSLVAQTFGKTALEVSALLRSKVQKVDFDSLIPPSGWIHDYIEWTRRTEPPTVFHFFSAAVAIGGSLGRRVFFDKGAYKVYPNLCVMLIAPTGRCRKTSAANLGTGLYARAGGTLLADKTTPEALIDALQTSGVGLIYAQELAVFLGKQKYQEGMIPLLTALFDCPDEWTSKTIGRGATTLNNVGLSSLMCSTPDWLQTSVPADVFGGGFMSRFLFVVQESTPRCFPLPPPLDPDRKKDLIRRLVQMRSLKGEFKPTPAATRWYDKWYRTRTGVTSTADKQFAGYYERKPDHLLRIAMILKAAGGGLSPDTMVLDEADMVAAVNVLGWLEDYLPGTFDQLASSTVGEDQIRILRHLRSAGGAMEHSALLRRNSSRMNADAFKRALGTLREARLVEYDAETHTYCLTPEGWN